MSRRRASIWLETAAATKGNEKIRTRGAIQFERHHVTAAAAGGSFIAKREQGLGMTVADSKRRAWHGTGYHHPMRHGRLETTGMAFDTRRPQGAQHPACTDSNSNPKP